MTRDEALLVQLAEEASEVAQAASKVLRFVRDHTWHTHEGTAGERVVLELIDLLVLVELCQEAKLLPIFSDEKNMTLLKAKKERVEKYLKLSIEMGMVQ